MQVCLRVHGSPCMCGTCERNHPCNHAVGDALRHHSRSRVERRHLLLGIGGASCGSACLLRGIRINPGLLSHCFERALAASHREVLLTLSALRQGRLWCWCWCWRSLPLVGLGLAKALPTRTFGRHLHCRAYSSPHSCPHHAAYVQPGADERQRERGEEEGRGHHLDEEDHTTTSTHPCITIITSE